MTSRTIVGFNRFGVGASGKGTCILLPSGGPLTRDEVRSLVAWLIVIGDIPIDTVASDVATVGGADEGEP